MFVLRLMPWCAILALSACGANESRNSLKEAWDSANHPARFAGTYDFRLEQLPREGQAQGPRWSGDYWPTDKGGIAQRWKIAGGVAEKAGYQILDMQQLNTVDTASLSPAEKYDIFADDANFSLTRLERARTRVLASIPGTSTHTPGFEIPSWEGLCHGWAPASILYQEPAPVKLRNRQGVEVSFGSADIKALLTYAMHEGVGSRDEQLGTRCEVNFAKLKQQLRDGQISEADFQRASESLTCRDTNAGSFHIILSNELGKHKRAFIADVTRDFEVWNQGVVSYRSEIGSIIQQRSAAAAPETVYEVEVSTQIDYIMEISSTWDKNGSDNIYRKADYRYRLELNGNKEIVGGQWLSEARPDFLWRKSRPVVSSRLNFLPEIYQASTGQNFFSGDSAGPQNPDRNPPAPQPDNTPSPQPTQPTPQPTQPTPQPPLPQPPHQPAPQPPRPLPNGGITCAPGDPWCLG